MLHRHRPVASRRGPKRLYVCLVTALASFLVGLALWRSPVRGYRAAATVSVRLSDQSDLQQTGTLVEKICSRSNLLHLYERLRVSEVSMTQSAPLDEKWLQHLKTHLDVVTQQGDDLDQRGDETAETIIEITYVDETEQSARALVEELVQVVVESVSQGGDPGSEAAHQQALNELDQAQVQAAKVRAALEEYLAEYLEQLQRNPVEVETTQEESTSRNGVPVEQSGQASVALSQQQRANPEWLNLQENIEALHQRRNELLTDRMETHPAIRTLADQIIRLESQQSEFPEYLYDGSSTDISATHSAYSSGAADDRSSPLVDAIQVTDSAEATWREPELEEWARRLVDIQDQSEQAMRRHNEAVRAERQTWLDSRTSPDHEVRIVEPARVLGPIYGPQGFRRVQFLGWIAVGIGAVFLVGTPAGAPDRVLSRVTQAIQMLPVPIVGTIATMDGPAMTHPRHGRQKLIRMFTWLSEVALTVFGISFLFCAIFENGFAIRFFHDPYVAVTGAIELAIQWLF